MKKLFLMIGAMAAFATAQAAPTRASGSLDFGYCGDDIGFTTGVNSAGSSGTIGGAIFVPEEIAAKWTGAKVTGLLVGFGQSSSPEVDIFIAESATYSAVYDSYTMDDIVVSQTAVMELQNDWNPVTLNNPYELKGNSFYVGFNTKMLYGDRPLALDGTTTDQTQVDNGDFIGINNEWVHGGPWFGRVCLKLVISGDNLPDYDVAISNLYIPPFVGQGVEFASDFQIQNLGVDPIESVTIQMKANGVVISEGTAVADTPLASGETVWMNATGLVCNEVGTDMNITASVIKVNGSDNFLVTGGDTSGVMSCSETTFYKNVLLEEFTGTWCGFCPRGIVGIEWAQENLADDGFICIAGHNGDEMVSTTYSQVVNTFSNGQFPSAAMDRSYVFDPSKDTIKEYFDYLKQYPAFAQIEFEANYNKDSGMIEIDSNTEFALDYDNSPYALTFVMCQNNVGPYAQTNYFSGGAYGPMGGWENMGPAVAWTYNEVARTSLSPFGITNSLPSSVRKGTKYQFSTEMVGENYAGVLANCYIVGMILNTKTYAVVNSAQTTIGGVDAGVESLVSEPANGVYVVYNLQGVKVMETADAANINNLPKGIYLVNGKKVMVK